MIGDYLNFSTRSMQTHLPTSPAVDPTLRTLLDANLRLPPEYRDQLTNHLPMALHALHCLGASSRRMQDFYAHYTHRFQGRSGPEPLALPPPAIDWRALRGQSDAYPTLLTHFNMLVAREGMDASLRLTLPDLMPGMSAAAFHGVIRAAHAVQAGHAPELAAALAYWAWRWQTLAVPPAAQTHLEFAPWAARLVQQSIGWRSGGALISIRMGDASQSAVYQALAPALAPAPSLKARIQEFAGLAVGRYAASPNFTVLHMVTGLRALRTLLPWLEDTVSAQNLLAQNVVAAYMAAQANPVAAPPKTAAHPWNAVVAAAIASDDDHVVKLVHACQEEAAVYGDGNYLRAATLVTGM